MLRNNKHSDYTNRMFFQQDKIEKTFDRGCGIITIFWLAVAITWCMNLYQLVYHCDFDFNKPLKNEIVHVVGLFPPVCLITAFYNVDDYKDVKK